MQPVRRQEANNGTGQVQVLELKTSSKSYIRVQLKPDLEAS